MIIAKGESTRLAGKNKKHFHGKPLFQWNLLKLLDLFDEVVVDSDDEEILQLAGSEGAISHVRNPNVMGNDVPSIPIFKSILDDFQDFEGVINVQANSPNVKKQLIEQAYKIFINNLSDHLLTLNADMTWNGSIWCISKEIIFSVKDFYNIEPDVYLLDDSVDIHTQEEFELALARQISH